MESFHILDYPSNIILIIKHLPSSKNMLPGGPGHWMLLEPCHNPQPCHKSHWEIKLLKGVDANLLNWSNFLLQKFNSYGVCEYKGVMALFLPPINLQSIMLILHFNHCLLNDLMMYAFGFHSTWFNSHPFGLPWFISSSSQDIILLLSINHLSAPNCNWWQS